MQWLIIVVRCKSQWKMSSLKTFLRRQSVVESVANDFPSDEW